jgi:uncharacterized protein YndB with AHSA1/START domain
MPGPEPSTVERPSDHEVVFRRLLDAPAELAWKIWSDPEHLRHWFGPAGFTLTTLEFDFVPGGVWRFVMHAPDGTDNPNRVVFREIVPTSRLVYENSWDRPGAPLDFLVVVTFEPEGRRTRFSIRMTFRDARAMKTAVEMYGVLPGGIETLDKVVRYLSAFSD